MNIALTIFALLTLFAALLFFYIVIHYFVKIEAVLTVKMEQNQVIIGLLQNIQTNLLKNEQRNSI